jgi:phosphatidylinositol glycan class W
MLTRDSDMIISYKEEQEQFVANLTGTSIICIIVLLLNIVVYVFFAKLVYAGLQKTTASPVKRFLREHILLVLPTLLTMTVLSDLMHFSLAAMLCIITIKYWRTILTVKIHAINDIRRPHKLYLTEYKGIVVLMTCMSILAVDFRVFPRAYGKTETFGTSLMDIGVGFFLISTGVTSKHARGLGGGQEGLEEKGNDKKKVQLLND